MTVAVSSFQPSTSEFEFSALREANNYRAAIVQEFAPYLRGRVLEVGAGVGQMTAGLRKVHGVEHLVAVEPNPVFCDRFRTIFRGHDIIEGTVQDVPTDMEWNTIVSINVLEHIRDDVKELKAYKRLLRPTVGYLCLFVPARPEIYAPIDQDFGHCRRYVKEDLAEKLKTAGFHVLQLRYFNFVGYFAWWLNFCVLRRREFDPAKVSFFDRVIFPKVHWFETKIARPSFGQSLLAVAKVKWNSLPD
jgi:SAM-dependent methyltransferase